MIGTIDTKLPIIISYNIIFNNIEVLFDILINLIYLYNIKYKTFILDYSLKNTCTLCFSVRFINFQ